MCIVYFFDVDEVSSASIVSWNISVGPLDDPKNDIVAVRTWTFI